MATAPKYVPEEFLVANTGQDLRAERNRETITGLVRGFAAQDIDSIMVSFADDAVYHDILGRDLHGSEARGKASIRLAFLRQFAIAGEHTFVEGSVAANAENGFASWTLVLGKAADGAAARFAGIDEFQFDEAGKVTSKKAWLKGTGRLQRSVAWRNPRGWGAQVRYLVSGASR